MDKYDYFRYDGMHKDINCNIYKNDFMVYSMIHNEAYSFPETDPMGYSDTSEYLIVNCIGYYEFEDYFKPTHRINGRKDYFLAYNLNGKMKVRIRGIEHILEPGSLFLYRPFEEQCYGKGDDQSLRSYWVHFTGYGVEELLLKAELAEGSVFHIGQRMSIVDLFDGILAEVQNKDIGYELAASSLLMTLMSAVSRRIGADSQEKVNRIRNEIFKTVKYINDNYSRKISVKELARMAYFCRDRYARLFKEFMGVPPQQYMIRLRIQKACELMKRTSLNIAQISLMVGFNDQLYFSRVFKKYEEMTPSDYRLRQELA